MGPLACWHNLSMDSRSISTDDGVLLHVAGHGEGPDVVVLSGGPGCIHYLADECIAHSHLVGEVGELGRLTVVLGDEAGGEDAAAGFGQVVDVRPPGPR